MVAEYDAAFRTLEKANLRIGAGLLPVQEKGAS